MQKGFAPILIVLLIAAAISGYFIYNNYSNNRTKTVSQNPKVENSKYKITYRVGGTFIDSGDLWTMNPDGSNKKQITKTGNIDKVHAWSPDNKFIAVTLSERIKRDNKEFVDQTIAVVNPETGEVKKLKENEYKNRFLYRDPTWYSNDKLLQIGVEPEEGIITTSIIDGKVEKLVTLPEKHSLEFPDTDIKNNIALSPDHKFIAYDTVPKSPYMNHKSHLYAYNLDNNTEKQLTGTEGGKLHGWNKDQIIFTSNSNEIWRINVDDTGLSQVLEDNSQVEHSVTPGYIASVEASKDGNYLLYCRDVGWAQCYLSHYTSGQKIMVVKQIFNDRPMEISLSSDNSFIVYAQRSGTHDETKEPVVCFTRFIRDDYPIKTTTDKCFYPRISN